MNEAEFDAIAAAPGHVNLLGEHSGCDEGILLAVAIGQRTRVAMRRSHGQVFTLHAQEPGETVQFAFDAPPTEPIASCVFGCLALARERCGDIPPLDIEVASDLPMGKGLSSGAALEVATLRCLRQLLDLRLDDVALAQLAQRAGIGHAQSRRDSMGPMAASLAGTDRALLIDTRSLQHRDVPLPPHSAVLVLDSGVPRTHAASGSDQRRLECEEAARRLGLESLRDVQSLQQLDVLPDLLLRRARHVFTENQRALEAADCRDPAIFGALMDASHFSLRDDYQVSTAEIDRLVALLQNHEGVYGARLTGAGFGGAVVALCQPEALQEIADDVLAQYFAAGYDGQQLVPHKLSSRP